MASTSTASDAPAIVGGVEDAEGNWVYLNVATADPEGFKDALLDGLHVDDRFYVLAPEMPSPDGQICLVWDQAGVAPPAEWYRASVLAEPIALVERP